jgi:hypothetical protein
MEKNEPKTKVESEMENAINTNFPKVFSAEIKIRTCESKLEENFEDFLNFLLYFPRSYFLDLMIRNIDISALIDIHVFHAKKV